MAKQHLFCAGAYPALQRTLFLSAFKPGAVNRSMRVSLDVAGKAVNAARALKRLGTEPVLGGFTGGSSGEEIERLLKQEGLLCTGFLTVDAPVRICQTILPSDGSPFTELVEEGPELDAVSWSALTRHCCHLLESGQFAGAILAGTMPEHAALDFYPALIRAADIPVILDTSGPALLSALQEQPALVKINADELRATLPSGDGHDIISRCRKLLKLGARSVGVTQGRDAAYLVTRSSAWRFEIPAVKTVSALGSGDCVNAGVLFSICRGASLVDAFVFGLACGTANAEVAAPGDITPAAVDALVAKIRTYPL